MAKLNLIIGFRGVGACIPDVPSYSPAGAALGRGGQHAGDGLRGVWGIPLAVIVPIWLLLLLASLTTAAGQRERCILVLADDRSVR